MDLSDLPRLIAFALSSHPEKVMFIPLSYPGILMDSARENDKRPAYLKVATTDGMVSNQRGVDTLRDEVVILRIPRYVVDRYRSNVVLPGEE